MSSMIGDCMALFQNQNIRAKYQLFLNGGGVVHSAYQPKRGVGFKIRESEITEICKQYTERVPVYTISDNVQRSPDSIRNVLKRAGIYDKNREALKGPIAGYTKTKTVRVEIK